MEARMEARPAQQGSMRSTTARAVPPFNWGPHHTGGLPPITYQAGGLENADIRKAVCDILEGGEAAFRERARRLRVRLER